MSAEDSDRNDLRAWLEHGSEGSFGAIVARYTGLVHQVALRRTQSVTMAEEVTQSTFLLLARKARSLSSSASIGGWLMRVAYNEASNARRSEVREIQRRESFSASSQTPSHSGWDEVRAELDAALSRISAKDREILIMRHYRGLEPPAIARELGVSLPATHQRLSRALTRLRAEMQRAGYPAASCLALLVALPNDAHAAEAIVRPITAKALAAASAPLPVGSGAAAILLFMNTKTVVIAITCLLAGGAAWTLSLPGKNKLPDPRAPQASSGGSADSQASGDPQSGQDGNRRTLSGKRAISPGKQAQGKATEELTYEDLLGMSPQEIVDLNLDVDNPPTFFTERPGLLNQLLAEAHLGLGQAEKAMALLAPERVGSTPFVVIGEDYRQKIEAAIAEGKEAVVKLAEEARYDRAYVAAVSSWEAHPPADKVQLLRYWAGRPMGPANHSSAMVALGEELESRGDLKEAIEVLREAAKITHPHAAANREFAEKTAKKIEMQLQEKAAGK